MGGRLLKCVVRIPDFSNHIRLLVVRLLRFFLETIFSLVELFVLDIKINLCYQQRLMKIVAKGFILVLEFAKNDNICGQ